MHMATYHMLRASPSYESCKEELCQISSRFSLLLMSEKMWALVQLATESVKWSTKEMGNEEMQ